MLPKNLSTQSYEQLQDRLKGLQGELKETEKLQERFQKGVDDKSDVRSKRRSTPRRRKQTRSGWPSSRCRRS